ncbi:nuclear transport factor 2 family protein [Streptomyces tubbatahanensis]|uniref:Nuclear transport factor 2 family protein n=1 Tax=Streptomyces tubbatahanensis TaxID=2923272 RepID=A0ABY3XYM5_9ACTN|nr:nuclear transport factor 2 family protein [Streptomyces tubbatahanensis]UNS99661.1 nuclear transport factor 2 family protein [Streptomyces tubbatahanensis]
MASSETPTKPADVARHLLDLLLHKEMDQFCDMWAEDGTVEIPFAAPGAISHMAGRETIRSYLTHYCDHQLIDDLPHVHIHETTDPEVVIAEWTAHGTTVSTGKKYEMKYIIVITVRDGKVVNYRDYFSPLLAARAANDRTELLAPFKEEDFPFGG